MKTLKLILACCFILFPLVALSVESEELLFAECPSSPNCVSSQSKSLSHKVEPLQFRGTLFDFHQFIQKIEKEIPNSKVIRIEGPFVSMVVSSRVFRFKDDVELYFVEQESLIHVRSASRLGYSDLGVNRKRVEAIRKISAQQRVPLVIAHRGASGYRPEHTLEAYQLAIEMGADFIEPDLVSTKDGVLIARHENEISGTTDVADKFPGKKTTKVVDGQSITGWFTEDLTLSEIKTLKAKERLSTRSQKYNGQFLVPTFSEILSLVKSESMKRSRAIGIYPETKHPTYFKRLNLALDKKLVSDLKAAKLDSFLNPIFIQSFELSILKDLKTQTEHPLIFLIGDLAQVPSDHTGTQKKQTYQQLLTDESLKRMKSYIAGVGFHKSHLLDSDFIRLAHKHQLLVHVYTFRSDPAFLEAQYKGQPDLEYLHFFKLGVDGVFSDFPDDALKARKLFLESPGF